MNVQEYTLGRQFLAGHLILSGRLNEEGLGVNMSATYASIKLWI